MESWLGSKGTLTYATQRLEQLSAELAAERLDVLDDDRVMRLAAFSMWSEVARYLYERAWDEDVAP